MPSSAREQAITALERATGILAAQYTTKSPIVELCQSALAALRAEAEPEGGGKALGEPARCNLCGGDVGLLCEDCHAPLVIPYDRYQACPVPAPEPEGSGEALIQCVEFECESCGADTITRVKQDAFCHGCGKTICQSCCDAFDHFKDGLHGTGDPTTFADNARARLKQLDGLIGECKRCSLALYAEVATTPQGGNGSPAKQAEEPPKFRTGGSEAPILSGGRGGNTQGENLKKSSGVSPAAEAPPEPAKVCATCGGSGYKTIHDPDPQVGHELCPTCCPPEPAPRSVQSHGVVQPRERRIERIATRIIELLAKIEGGSIPDLARLDLAASLRSIAAQRAGEGSDGR